MQVIIVERRWNLYEDASCAVLKQAEKMGVQIISSNETKKKGVVIRQFNCLKDLRQHHDAFHDRGMENTVLGTEALYVITAHKELLNYILDRIRGLMVTPRLVVLDVTDAQIKQTKDRMRIQNPRFDEDLLETIYPFFCNKDNYMSTIAAAFEKAAKY